MTHLGHIVNWPCSRPVWRYKGFNVIMTMAILICVIINILNFNLGHTASACLRGRSCNGISVGQTADGEVRTHSRGKTQSWWHIPQWCITQGRWEGKLKTIQCYFHLCIDTALGNKKKGLLRAEKCCELRSSLPSGGVGSHRIFWLLIHWS